MLRTRCAPAWALALVTVAAPGCTQHRPPESPRSAAIAPVRVQSDDEYEVTRASYDALAVGDPRRTATRLGLESFAIAESARQLKANRPEAALEDFLRRVLALWDAEELKAPPPDPPLQQLAAELERAFRRRGAHQEVLTTLAVQIALAPDDAAARTRFDQVLGWLRNDPPRAPEAPAPACAAATCGRIIEDLEAATAAWPSPFLVDALGRLYHDRQRWQHPTWQRGLSGDLADIVSQRTGTSAAYDLARLHLRVSRADLARAEVEKLSGEPGDDAPLRTALTRYAAADGKPTDAIAVAALFFRDPADRPIALRVCEDAAKRFPKAIEPLLCIGDVAEQRNQIVRATRAFEAALAISPDKREAWEALARLQQKRLFQLVADEKTGELEAQLKRVEQLHLDALRRFPGAPLKVSLAGALFEVGRGYFNVGRVDDAVRFFERSLAVEPTVVALEQLAVVAVKRGDGKGALGLLDRGLTSASALDRREFLYWRAKLGRGVGDAQELAGDEKAALAARRQAASDYDLLLAMRGNLGPEEVAETELERGKALYLVGNHEQGIIALERAIDAAPDRASTYADVLAFLIPRGEREEALDAYHRALGRSEVSEYIKVYCTLWILDLDRRAGQPEDPLARAFVDGVDGGKWYHELARWASGRQSESDLLAHAQSPGNRAEAYFYLAMRRLQGGKLDEARDLWQKVLETQMMAFFEYDMSAYYLRRGARATPAPATATPTATPAKIPDGSI
ncbi:MAG: hypothetical protein EXR72_24670 [Myxococcales bacterium]|nr:hypothetical protein [Myxococcales bacterium]